MVQGAMLALILWPMAGAGVSFAVGRRAPQTRDAVVAMVCAIELALSLTLGLPARGLPLLRVPGLLGGGLLLSLDGFRWILASASSFLWLASSLFSVEYFEGRRDPNRYHAFSLLTLGGALGVFLSGNLLTTLIFFEIMSLASYLLVVEEETPGAVSAGRTYLTVSIWSGACVLAGVGLLQGLLGTTDFSLLRMAVAAYAGPAAPMYAAGGLLLIGFGAKAGMFPLHFWLPDAHAAAPAPASALLSGVLTKVGVFGILALGTRVFADVSGWGVLLLVAGFCGMATGAVRALLETNLKRALACSSVSQIGFILMGAGLQVLLGGHNALAVRGTLLHMVNHSLFKLLLFLLAGIIAKNLHALELDAIRGFGRGKPLFTGAFLVGALGLSGVPLFSGYVSKTLLHESLLEQIALSAGTLALVLQAAEVVFILVGGLTTAYMLKLFVCVCMEKSDAERPPARYRSKTCAALLAVCVVLVAGFGVAPSLMMRIGDIGADFFGGAAAHGVAFFAWESLRGAVCSLLVGVVVYFVAVRWLHVRRGKGVFGWYRTVFRPIFGVFFPGIVRGLARVLTAVETFLSARLEWSAQRLRAMGDVRREKREVASYMPFPATRSRYEAACAQATAASGERLPRVRARYEKAAFRRRRKAMDAPGHLRRLYAQGSSAVAARTKKMWEGGGDLLPKKKRAADPGVYERVVRAARRLQAGARKAFRVPEMLYHPFSEAKDAILRNEMMRSMFASLTFSFLVYLFGFLVVLMLIL